MSFTVGVELVCDFCSEWLGDHHHTKKSAWEAGKLFGWKKIKGKHCCEKCVAKKRTTSGVSGVK